MTRDERNAYNRRYRTEHPEFHARTLAKVRIHTQKRKIRVLTHYGKGGKLCCRWSRCRVRDVDMLSIDHVTDNGADHREAVTEGRYRTGGGMSMYRWLEQNSFPEGYQTLCHNHQWKKEILRRRAKTMIVKS